MHSFVNLLVRGHTMANTELLAGRAKLAGAYGGTGETGRRGGVCESVTGTDPLSFVQISSKSKMVDFFVFSKKSEKN